MSSDPPAEREEADDEDRSYEKQVQEELVPEVTIGDDQGDIGDDDQGGIDDDDPASISEKLEEDFTSDEEAASLSEALGEVDDELGNAFVGIVVGIKLGVILVSAGVLAGGFAGMPTFGGALVAVGCLAFARAGQRYWAYERTRKAASEGERSDTDDAVGDDGEAASKGRNG